MQLHMLPFIQSTASTHTDTHIHTLSHYHTCFERAHSTLAHAKHDKAWHLHAHEKYKHLCLHVLKHLCTQIPMLVYMQAWCLRTCKHRCLCTYVFVYMQAEVFVYSGVCVHASMGVCIFMCMHVVAHVHARPTFACIQSLGN